MQELGQINESDPLCENCPLQTDPCRPAASLLAAARPARAAASVYRYSSDDFTSIRAGACFTVTNRATMTITLAKPIPSNYVGLAKPKACVASEGLTRFTNLTIGTIPGGTPKAEFEVWTDASGNIINWYVYVESLVASENGVLWAVLLDNIPGSSSAIAQAVEDSCGGFAEGTNVGLWITR